MAMLGRGNNERYRPVFELHSTHNASPSFSGKDGSFQETMDPFRGSPITRIIICLGLYWGPLLMETLKPRSPASQDVNFACVHGACVAALPRRPLGASVIKKNIILEIVIVAIRI